MRVVSNTSPVSNLAIAGNLDLLRQKFGEIIIPKAVETELFRLSHKAGLEAIQHAMKGGWIRIEPLADTTLIPILLKRIDVGEAEAIELARQSKADWLLLDDMEARTIAKEEQLSYVGIVGLLCEEKEAGRIKSLKAELDRLRSECRFFISPKLEEMVLRRVGER